MIGRVSLPRRLALAVAVSWLLLINLVPPASADPEGGALMPPPPRPVAAPVQLPRGADDIELADTLHEQLRALAEEDKFSGVVLLARDGTPFFHEAYGFANRKTRLSNSIATAFDAGSITKILTRTAIAQLLQAGKLTLDARIVDYLPDYPNADVAHAVTLRHLLDHSSGLGDIFNERWMSADKRDYVNPEDFFALFADAPLAFAPGSSQAYSNAGYIVLGAIVEAVSGRSYSQYLEENVFAPAGMSRSGLELRDGKNPDLAVGYAPFGPDRSLVDNIGMLPVQGCPAGSSMHTAEDLLKFDRALRGGVLLNPEWSAWVYHSEDVLEDAGYDIGLAGGAPGVNTALNSNGRITVIVLSNFDPPTGDALALDLYRLLTGKR